MRSQRAKSDRQSARSGGRAPRDDVVGGEDDRRAGTEEPAIGLRRAEPLQVQDVRLVRGELQPCRTDARAAFTASRARDDPIRDESG